MIFSIIALSILVIVLSVFIWKRPVKRVFPWKEELPENTKNSTQLLVSLSLGYETNADFYHYAAELLNQETQKLNSPPAKQEEFREWQIKCQTIATRAALLKEILSTPNKAAKLVNAQKKKQERDRLLKEERKLYQNMPPS